MRQIAILKQCTQQEKDLLSAAVQSGDVLHFFETEQQLLESPQRNSIEIIFGEPAFETVLAMRALRWIQMSWAGANKYTSLPDFPSHITLTSASGAFGGVISEHILMGILALYKNLPAYRKQLQAGQWQLLSGDTTLEGKRALILGTGNIGTETAKKLKAFGAYTVGLSRTSHQTSAFFDESYTIDALDSQLPDADLVIIALPGTKETRQLLNARRIGALGHGTVVINVGRGFIVDTEALTEALEKGHLRGAVLDVTDPEPLPADHPLRFLGNVILTPHVSGISWGENTFTRRRILELFRENLHRDAQKLPLKNKIDFQLGY